MRQTKTRNALTKIFINSHEPVTAGELIKKLKIKHLEVNKTTVYRQLESLKNLNFIKEVTFRDGRQRFEIVEDHCHHHVVCQSCGKVADVDIDEQKLISSVKKQVAFKIDSHSIEFFGLCNSCK